MKSDKIIIINRVCRGENMSLSKINSSINLEYLKKEKENLYFDRKRAKISLQDLANEIASFAN